PFANVDELAAELHAAETALADMQSISIAASLVRPVRWEVEIFGLRAMSLDMRQNTTVINRVLAEIWRKMNPLIAADPPAPSGPEWAKWIN
ncbi:phosphoenolpyruvate carboxylase, partial [Klebsiella pneumoniae]|nr:phosphoenolpyruvate carboxylase [Klebsiella pneumoniae]